MMGYAGAGLLEWHLAPGGAGGCEEDPAHTSQYMPGSRSRSYLWEYDGNLWVYGGRQLDNDGFDNTAKLMGTMYMWDGADWQFFPHPTDKVEVQTTNANSGGSGVYHLDYCPHRRYGGNPFRDVDLLYLFGGYAQESSTVFGLVNDVWAYNITKDQWAWISGDANHRVADTYNHVNEDAFTDLFNAHSDYVPGGREGAASWDYDGHLWIFGGLGWSYPGTHALGFLADMWRFDKTTHEWMALSDFKSIGSYSSFSTNPSVRSCSNSGKGQETGIPPCWRSGAMTWQYGTKLFLFGGHAVFRPPTDAEKNAPFYLHVFYNELYEFETLNYQNNVAPPFPWKHLSGSRPEARTTSTLESFSGNNLIFRATRPAPASWGLYFPEASAHPGGTMGAAVIQMGRMVVMYGGFGHGEHTSDYLDTAGLPAVQESFHCKYNLQVGGDYTPINFNASCGGMNDVWAYDTELNKWSYILGDSNAELWTSYREDWSSYYVDFQAVSLTAKPFGRGWAQGYWDEAQRYLSLYGGGQAWTFGDVDVPLATTFSDMWNARFKTCDGLPWFHPEVCGGTTGVSHQAFGYCDTKSADCVDDECKCVCTHVNHYGDFCEHLYNEFFTCYGLDPLSEDACGGEDQGSCEGLDGCVCINGWSGDECDECGSKNCTGYSDTDNSTPVDWNLVGYIAGGVAAGIVVILVCLVIVMIVVAIIAKAKGVDFNADVEMKSRKHKHGKSRKTQRKGKGKRDDDEDDGEWTEGEGEWTDEEEGEWTDGDDEV